MRLKWAAGCALRPARHREPLRRGGRGCGLSVASYGVHRTGCGVRITGGMLGVAGGRTSGTALVLFDWEDHLKF